MKFPLTNKLYLITLLYLIVFFWVNSVFAQVKLCSWNLKDLGQSKSEVELDYIAQTLNDFDLVAIQEVVASYQGTQAVAKLIALLNRKGGTWHYAISNPTSGTSYKRERYAFLWKPSKVSLIGKPYLEQKYHIQIDREPFLAQFSYQGKTFTVVNFHAITQKKQPETEIKYLKHFPEHLAKHNLIFLGDFNCTQNHSVFNPLKAMGFTPLLKTQKTSLKKSCKAECLASAFDNVFFQSHKLRLVNKGVLHFYKDFASLNHARQISDHIPVWFSFVPL